MTEAVRLLCAALCHHIQDPVVRGAKSFLQAREFWATALSSLRRAGRTLEGLLLHWPVQLILERRFLELAMRQQPIGHGRPEETTPENGWDTPAVVGVVQTRQTPVRPNPWEPRAKRRIARVGHSSSDISSHDKSMTSCNDLCRLLLLLAPHFDSIYLPAKQQQTRCGSFLFFR